jgi:hypothetical protein
MFKEEDLRQAFIVPGPGAYEYLCTGRIFTRFLAAAGGLIPVERTDALSLLRCRYHHYPDFRNWTLVSGILRPLRVGKLLKSADSICRKQRKPRAVPT